MDTRLRNPRLRFLSVLLRCFAIGWGIDFVVMILDGQINWYFLLGAVVMAGVSTGVSIWTGRERPLRVDHQLIGVRGFVFGENGRLCSLTHRGGAWEKGVNLAGCYQQGSVSALLHDHVAPAEGCHCGFNVWHSLEDLRCSGYQYRVAAVVRGYGKARLHPDGWRSEKAEILALIDDSWIQELAHGVFPTLVPRFLHHRGPVKDRIKLEAAAMRYDVPIISAQQALAGLDEFGTSVPESLRPKVGQ